MSLGSTVFLKDSFQLVSGAQVTTTSNDVVSSVGGRNLYSEKKRNTQNLGTGGTLDLNNAETPYGFYTVGTSTDTDDIRMFDVINGNGAYTVSFEARGSQNGAGGLAVDANKKSETLTSNPNFRKTSTDNSYSTFSIVLNVTDFKGDGTDYISWNPTWSYVWVKNIKVEKGINNTPIFTIAPEDIPYDTQTSTLYKTNISLSEPLRSVGDVRDRLYLNAKGLWEVERNVGEVLMNNLVISTTAPFGGGNSYHFGGSVAFIVNTPNPTSPLNSPIASSHFKDIRNTNNYNDTVNAHISRVGTMTRISGERHRMFIRISEKTIDVVEGASIAYLVSQFKKWLLANNVKLVYQLATPTIETLPAEQQTKLNNIQSFKGSNYVYTMGSVIPNLNATFKSIAWHRNYVTARDTSEVAGALGGLKDFTDGAFTDGIISRAEAKAIAEHLNTLNKEKSDVDANYNTVYGNAKLTGTPKTNLLSAKTAWNTAHANLISTINTAIADSKTTVAEKADVDSKFTAYGTSFKLLTKMLQEATIASGKTQSDESAQGAVEGIKLGVVNLVVRTGELVGYLPGGGTVVPTALTSRVMLKRIKVTPGEVLTFTKTTVIGDAYWRVDLHNSAGAYVTRFADLSNSFQYTVPADIYEIRVSYPAEAKVQIERGTKATEWKESPEDSDEKLNKKTGIPVRYIRDWLNNSTAKNGNHWVALQAKTLEGIDRASGILPTSDLALTNPATLTNGITATSSYVTGVNTGIQYIQVDLGKTYYDISDIRVWHYYADGRTYNDTKTEISVDGTNWEPLYESLTQGTYPETAEGHILPMSVVDRIRIITSRVALAEQVITPEAITGTVMSQETFVEWKENVDTKANGEDVDNLMLEMGNVQDTLNGTDTTEGIITKMSTVEQKADSWSADITELKEVTGAQGVVTEKVTAYMEFNMTGLEIGKSDSDMKVNISNSQIDFMDKGVSVAYINGQRMFITHVEITESLIIGNHKIEKLEGNSDVTIVSWVGQRG